LFGRFPFGFYNLLLNVKKGGFEIEKRSSVLKLGSGSFSWFVDFRKFFK
jgi:hypothetical protein